MTAEPPIAPQIAGDNLKTLESDGQVPETRLGTASDANSLVRKWILADRARDQKRAMAKGLVDGNPPYRQTDLDDAGRSDACNVNWRMAESYLAAALGAFYDIFSEAKTFATVQLDVEDTQKSLVVTDEFHRLLSRNPSFDYEMQISQYEMVLFGVGPIMFMDKMDWRFEATQCKNLLTPENAKSDPNKWEACAIRTAYLPHKLYEYILNEDSAKATGWNVESVKQAIIHAHPRYQDGNQYLNWEWHQQQLKNASYYYSAQSKQVFAVHLFVKEFPKDGEVEGRITHAIVLENYGSEKTGMAEDDFLYKNIGRFKSWEEALHPMYYDHGGGGEHHSVTGMGVKMYSAMEYQNRLMCNMADKVFAPKVMFKPTTANDQEVLSIANLGEFGLIPKGFDPVLLPTNQVMQESLAFNREVTSTVASNLSQYRQNLQEKSGNPITAKEADIRYSEQTRLGKTQLNRYYAQMDGLYEQIYKRAINPNLTKSTPGGKEALEFQRRCLDRGVSKDELQKVDFVQATRITGQGSAYARIQALESLLALVGSLPESGRDHLIEDYIASKSGQFSVKRYYPQSPSMQRPNEQNERAMNQVGNMHDGIPAVVADTQNPVIFAQTFLQASAQGLNSVQQGANPTTVLAFVELCGQAIAAHLQRMANDPTRKRVYQVLLNQFKQVAQLTDKLKAQVQQQLQKQAQAQAQQQRPDPELQIKAQEAQAKIQQNAAKTQQALQLKRESHNQQVQSHQQKHAQEMALKDAALATDIRNQTASTAAEIERKAKESQAKESAIRSKSKETE